ncbi:MAG TPA: hypothetical protein VGH49_03700 [Xanthobacteraceae bacterium]
MSDPRNDPVMPPPHERNGCMTAMMIAIGLVLLLPGICALLIVGFDPKEAFNDAGTMVAFLAIGAAGVFLIRAGVKRQR